MSDCLFCKIRDEEIPSTKVYEDNNIFAFLDINPVNPGHTLVVPKKHVERMSRADDAILALLVSAGKKVGRAVCEALQAPAYNFSTNNGPEAGQVIHHLHFHLVPRFTDDGYHLWSGKSYQEKEMEKVAEKIKSKL